jgi:adrenodoxin-NADP+ reductase
LYPPFIYKRLITEIMNLFLKGTIVPQRFLSRLHVSSFSFSTLGSLSSPHHGSSCCCCSSSATSILTAHPLTQQIKRQKNHILISKRNNSTNTTTTSSINTNNDRYHDDQLNQASPQTLSVAIVGTGPSGCYTAKYLLSSFSSLPPKDHLPFASIQIDMIEKLPTPFGLVRSGVAPDHPEVKNVMHDFSKLFLDDFLLSSSSSSSLSSLSREEAGENHFNQLQQQQQDLQSQQRPQETQKQVEFWGNVHVGKDISLKELQSLYHIVVLAYGCESDQRLGIEGEDSLHGIFSAREFVAWYNGHPEFVSLGDKVKELMKQDDGDDDGHKETNVVVIGQGNVALDCARVLVKGQRELMDTDIASDALNVIGDGVRRTTVLGRRGHVQGAFTIKELRELTKLDQVDFVVEEKELDEGATLSSLEELRGDGARPKVRIDKLLRDVARLRKEEKREKHHHQQHTERPRKEVILRFLLNPVKFLPNALDGTRVGSVLCERTRLEGQPGRQVAVGTGVMEEIPADMVLVSIGYKGVKLPGMDDSLFEARRGIVRNTHGKVIDNLYVSGWLKRGPSGIIGTNIVDAKDTVSSILKDLEDESHWSRKIVKGRSGLGLLLLERGVRYVDWASYQRIDAAETDPLKLRSKNQPREKITSVEEMLTYVK